MRREAPFRLISYAFGPASSASRITPWQSSPCRLRASHYAVPGGFAWLPSSCFALRRAKAGVPINRPLFADGLPRRKKFRLVEPDFLKTGGAVCGDARFILAAVYARAKLIQPDLCHRAGRSASAENAAVGFFDSNHQIGKGHWLRNSPTARPTLPEYAP